MTRPIQGQLQITYYLAGRAGLATEETGVCVPGLGAAMLAPGGATNPDPDPDPDPDCNPNSNPNPNPNPNLTLTLTLAPTSKPDFNPTPHSTLNHGPE